MPQGPDSPAEERLDAPRFDGYYSAESRRWKIQFMPDRSVWVGDNEGQWLAADGHVEFDFGFWRCGGPIGRTSLFLECVRVTPLGDAIEGEVAEFALRPVEESTS